MGKISKIPAPHCIFLKEGFCAYNEILNPGFDTHVQCKVLLELEQKYDHLLAQAENFQLDGEQVQKIWKMRFGNDLAWEMFCSVYHARSAEDDRCMYLLGNACILLFPRCNGICSWYTVGRPQKDIED